MEAMGEQLYALRDPFIGDRPRLAETPTGQCVRLSETGGDEKRQRAPDCDGARQLGSGGTRHGVR